MKPNLFCKTSQIVVEIFQRLAKEFGTFRVSLPTKENLKFGEESSMDLMFLESEAVLHLVDIGNRFSANTLLNSQGANFRQTVKRSWLEFVMDWCLMYSAYPNRLRTDHGSIFTSLKSVNSRI